MSSSRVLLGKTALITGAAKGIGAQMIESFAAAGANVIACVREQSDSLQHHFDALSHTHGVQVKMLCFDLMYEDAIKQAMHGLHASKTRVDVLVNNAGVMTSSLLGMTPIDSFKSTFQVNFFAPVQITQYVAKLMMKQRHGAIINIGSIAGLDNFAGYSAYGSSKAALMQFTRILANELASYDVRVNAVAPALVDTPMAKKMGSKAAEGIFSRSALKRMTKPYEIAEIAVFLASDKASFINGQTIRVDGGM
jgi:3-oxoacyl-[acyl-carrier protein] reductase